MAAFHYQLNTPKPSKYNETITEKAKDNTRNTIKTIVNTRNVLGKYV